MSLELIIDTRERDLIKKIKDTNEIKIEQLDLGDIIFKKENEIILIIERKTVQDLKASICDGRHREQKARLLGSGIPSKRIMYLIEGNLNKKLEEKIQGFSVSSLVGSLVNTQLRDDIKVYKTLSLDESCEFIKKLFIKLNSEDSKKYFVKHEIKDVDYCKTLKKKKNCNMTPNIWFISQLSLIPQITEKIAKEITIKYPSLKILIDNYEKIDEEKRKKMLSDITYPIKNNKVRRIGDKISIRIYEFIYNIKK
jgi:ERCC4-type nuclease